MIEAGIIRQRNTTPDDSSESLHMDYMCLMVVTETSRGLSI